MPADSDANGQGRISADVKAGVVKRFFQIAVSILLQAALLFLSAWRLDWVMAWVFLGLNVAAVGVNALVLLRIDPELIAERARRQDEAKGWDKILTKAFGVPAFLAIPIVAGLDIRFGWSAGMPLPFYPVAAVIWTLGFALISWAMASNRFFSTVVRIQQEREHTVVTGGPYQYVRHPGYVGITVMILATPPLLGSWWALVPVACSMLVLIVRTVLEDRTLQAELDGYRDYAQRVRYRLLPGVW